MQEVFVNSEKKRIIIRAGRRSGKGQPLNSILWTRHGPVSMGDAYVGMEIATPDGWTTIEDIFPLGERDIYRVSFRGGAEVECTDDHLWEVHTNRRNEDGNYRPARVMELSALRRKNDVELQRLSVPKQDAVGFNEMQQIEFSRRAQAQCIKVADPRGLYLTDGMIATHNTTGLSIRASMRFLDGSRVLYGGPTSDQLSIFWTSIKSYFREAVAAGVYNINETEMILEMPLLQSRSRVIRVPSQQRIRCKTVWNENTLRGDYGDELILDEYQLMNEDTWELVGAPMLVDNNGNAVFGYTPPSLKTRMLSRAADKLHAPKMFKRAQTDPRWHAIHFTSYDNPHISQAGLDEVSLDMTELAKRMELLAEDIEDVPNALWNRSQFSRDRYRTPDKELVRLVIGVDPTGSRDGDEVGIIAAGIDADGIVYVIDDASGTGMSPNSWARQVITAYYRHSADRVIGEVNFGGEMVESTLRTVDPTVSYKGIWSSRGKAVQAEPVAALYEQDKVFHTKPFPELEDQMCVSKGSLVATTLGRIPIEDVTVGSSVLTRSGWRKVLWQGMTGVKNTVDVETKLGYNIRVTPDHPIATADGFLAAGRLSPGDRIICLSPSRDHSFPPAHVPSSALVNAQSEMNIEGLTFLDSVIGVRTGPSVPVYDISVHGHHEFFANDILVHNCLWTPDSKWSPDRIDALVFAITELAIKARWSLIPQDY